MENQIKKEMIITQVGKYKLFGILEGELIVGFSDDGKEIYVREMGDEAGSIPFEDADKMGYED